MTNKAKKTRGQLFGLLASLVLISTSCFAFIPIFLLGILKLFPNQRWRTLCTQGIDIIASSWCSFNNLYVNRIINPRWEISGLEALNPKGWYLIVANHQSFLDIVVLQRLFHRKIPMLKFFIKDQLKWVPLLGFAWWAMGCPFMKRYSKEYLAKHPHKKGQDLLATRKAIEQFQALPASIMTFIEGTRFSEEKRTRQNSPHQHLLKPKAGGISFVISSMGHQLNNLLDITILYPESKHSLWDFLCKRLDSIQVIVRKIPIPPAFASAELIGNSTLQNEFKLWLNEQWCEKDRLIASFKEPWNPR